MTAEKINWRKLKLPKCRRKYKAYLQKLIKRHFDNLLHENDVNIIDNTLNKCMLTANCMLTAGRTILGIFPTHPNSPYNSTTIKCMDRKIKTKQRKLSQCRKAQRRAQLYQSIKQLRRQYNKIVEQEVYQKQLDIYDEVEKNSISVYHTLCKIKNNTSTTKNYCNLEDMLEFQNQHFNSKNRSWANQKLTYAQQSISILNAKDLFTRK